VAYEFFLRCLGGAALHDTNHSSANGSSTGGRGHPRVRPHARRPHPRHPHARDIITTSKLEPGPAHLEQELNEEEEEAWIAAAAAEEEDAALARFPRFVAVQQLYLFTVHQR